MKNWIISGGLAVLIATGACNSKKETRADEKNVITESQVPAPVKSAFTTKYPGASEIIWEDASEGSDATIKVKFRKDDKYWKAEFRHDGSFVKEKED